MTTVALKPTKAPVKISQVDPDMIEYIDLCKKLKVEFTDIHKFKESILIEKFSKFLSEKICKVQESPK